MKNLYGLSHESHLILFTVFLIRLVILLVNVDFFPLEKRKAVFAESSCWLLGVYRIKSGQCTQSTKWTKTLYFYFFSRDRKCTRKAIFTVLYAKTIFIYLKGNNMFKNIIENQKRFVKSAVKISGEIMS